MNAKDRKSIEMLAERVSDELAIMAQDIQERIQELIDCEQEKLDNLPDSLRYGDRGDRIQSGIDALESVSYDIDSIVSEMDSLADSLNDIAEDNF